MNGPAAQSNTTLLRKLLVVAVLMFGFGWALVPIYRKICEVTGINLLTDKETGVEGRLRNTQIECQNYAYDHGIDKPEVDQWTWPF